MLIGVAYRNDTRYRSGKGLKNRYPIINPTLVGSDRIAKHSYSDAINDMRGRNTKI